MVRSGEEDYNSQEGSGASARVFLIWSLLVCRFGAVNSERSIDDRVESDDQFEPRMRPKPCRVVDLFHSERHTFLPKNVGVPTT